MRIVAGKYGGRRLNTPKNNAIRPTSDKVRQAIFNSLHSRAAVKDKVVLDCFCGSGALGIEALSQGAAHCLFIDKDKISLNLTKENIFKIGAENASNFLLADSTKLKARDDKFKPASLVFLDPPYHQEMISLTIDSLIDGNWLLPSCLIVIETNKSESVSNSNLNILDEKKYGDTLITYGEVIL